MRKRKLVPLLCGLLVLTACKGRPAEPSLSPKPSEGMVQPTATAVGSPCLEESAPPTESPVSTVVPSSGPTPAPAATREPLPAPWGDTPPETEGERRMAYFRAVMERFYGDGLFPDGTPGDFSDEPLSQNRFAVHDVDGDGREELIVSIITAPQPARTALVYDYTDKKGLVLELKATSQLSFYDGIIQAGWPVDLTSGAGVLWPYTLYEYQKEEDTYAEAGSAQARTEALEGVKFPKEADRDGDGVVYCLNMDYEHPVDGAVYEAWRDRLIQGYEMQISYFPWTEEQIQAMEDILTLEKAKDLIEKANAALAPFLGEGAVPCEKEGWLLLEDYGAEEEIFKNMKAVFEDELAESFYARYKELIFMEEAGKVYVCDNSRDIVGHYYNMDMDTLFLLFRPQYSYFYDSEYIFEAEGFGNGTSVEWHFGIEWEEDILQINYYGCDDGSYDNFAILPGGIRYSVNMEGSPSWLGEPLAVDEGIRESGEDWSIQYRSESYPGFHVLLESYGDSDAYYAHYITVDGPGVPTDKGIEIGATLKEFLTAYPQFNMKEDHLNRLYHESDYAHIRRYPLSYEPEAASASYMNFRFNDDFVLEEIYLHYSESN